MRKLKKHIQPDSMSYLQKTNRGKNILLLLVSISLWLHGVMQDEIKVYTIVVLLSAFIMMYHFNSRLFALLTAVSVFGVLYFSEEVRYISLSLFAAILFIGSIFIIGAPKRTVERGFFY